MTTFAPSLSWRICLAFWRGFGRTPSVWPAATSTVPLAVFGARRTRVAHDIARRRHRAGRCCHQQQPADQCRADESPPARKCSVHRSPFRGIVPRIVFAAGATRIRTEKVHRVDRLNAESLVAEGRRDCRRWRSPLWQSPCRLPDRWPCLNDVRRLVSRARRGLGGARQRRCACRQRARQCQCRGDGEQGGTDPSAPRLRRLYGFLHDPGLDIVEPVRFHGADRSAVRADPHVPITTP